MREHVDALRERRKSVVADLVSMRNRWMEHRRQSGIEKRWRDSTHLYFGADIEQADEFRETLENGPSRRQRPSAQQQVRSRVVINIVRPKVDQAVARLAEIYLPVEGQAFGLEATRVPDDVQVMAGSSKPTLDPQTGQPTGMTADIEYKAIVAAAKESVKKHEDVIVDQAAECGYNAQIRIALEDYVRLGSMIIEGPVPTQSLSSRWVVMPDGQAMQQMDAKIAPAVFRRDPWDVWFDPACGNDHQRGAGYWVRRMVTRKELRDLVDQPGYSEADIRVVLGQTPTRATADARAKKSITRDDSFELYVYHGELEPECAHHMTALDDEPMGKDVTRGIFMLVNDHLIGAMPSWRQDARLPIAVACWRKTDDSPCGVGLPIEQKSQQSVVTASWRMLMDSGRHAISDQIIMRRKGLNPVTPGDYAIGNGPKLWWADEDIQDVGKVFGSVSFQSHLEEHLAIVKAAMEYSEYESNMPQLMGGSGGGQSHETLGGMELLFNNASVGLRHRVRTIDDDITSPIITGFYDWNMEFHPDPAIKIEAKVVARGSTALLERDIQNKNTIQLAAILQNPKYAPFVDPEKELDVVLSALRISPERIKLPPDVIENNKSKPVEQPPDPRIVSAQIGLEGKKLDITDRQQQREFELERNNTENVIRLETLKYNQQREDKEFAIAMTDAEIKRSTAVMKVDAGIQMNREGIIAKQRLTALDIDAQNQRFNAEAALRVSTGQGI